MDEGNGSSPDYLPVQNSLVFDTHPCRPKLRLEGGHLFVHHELSDLTTQLPCTAVQVRVGPPASAVAIGGGTMGAGGGPAVPLPLCLSVDDLDELVPLLVAQVRARNY